jgi:hypothetical protein
MRAAVLDWIDDRLDRVSLRDVEVSLRLSSPLDWSHGPAGAAISLKHKCVADDEMALDVVDYFLQRDPHLLTPRDEMNRILEMGGSAWEVSDDAGLQRRAVGPISEVIASTASENERVASHLKASWQKLVGRDPDPSGAYREAVRSVEVAAKRVVSPDNQRATLGTMIHDLENKPSNWDTVLCGGIELVIDQARSLWKGQRDRHGTDDESVPLNVSQAEADAAFHQALSLSRLFAGGGIWRAS